MVVQNGESPDSDGEDLGELFEPIFDPGFGEGKLVSLQGELNCSHFCAY